MTRNTKEVKARRAPPLTRRKPEAYDLAAWIITAALLLLTLALHLLPALLAGLLVYELVHILARRLGIFRLHGVGAKVVAVALLASATVGLLTLAIFGTVGFFRSELGSIPALLERMAVIIEESRAVLPAWAMDSLPADAETLKAAMAEWLRTHAGEVQVAGKTAGRVAAHILIGMVIGAMIALREAIPMHVHRPLTHALAGRAVRLGNAFRRVVFAQVRIAALNAFFTWLYLGVVLPLFGIKLPLVSTLVAITFIVGLLPVIGNLISNTVIVVVSLSHSLPVAIASLGYLVVIHKLEYFLNARIVGTQISARAWELLLAMLMMEAAFGLAGVVAAPIYYAYLKDELAARGLV